MAQPKKKNQKNIGQKQGSCDSKVEFCCEWFREALDAKDITQDRFNHFGVRAITPSGVYFNFLGEPTYYSISRCPNCNSWLTDYKEKASIYLATKEIKNVLEQKKEGEKNE